MRVAIITGATGGIGSEFCKSLDKQNLEGIVLLGRNLDAMEKIVRELKTPTYIIPIDLRDRQSLHAFEDSLRKKEFNIRFLINCAGFGDFGNLSEQNIKDVEGMIDVNVVALTELTRTCIPMMERGSCIVQVCSASAYLPLPCLNVYAATKAYVRSFSDALRIELKSKGINVLEVSPGWVDTGFIDHAVRYHSVPEKVFKHKVDPRDVVNQAMKDLKHGKNRSVCGFYNKLQVFVCRHMPYIASFIWIHSLR